MTDAKKFSFVFLLVESYPVVHDPRELQTILIHSLRELFGELEPHGCLTTVLETRKNRSIVCCPKDSVASVRAALTLCTPPLYLRGNDERTGVDGAAAPAVDANGAVYRFDVLQTTKDRNDIVWQ